MTTVDGDESDSPCATEGFINDPDGKMGASTGEDTTPVTGYSVTLEVGSIGGSGCSLGLRLIDGGCKPGLNIRDVTAFNLLKGTCRVPAAACDEDEGLILAANPFSTALVEAV